MGKKGTSVRTESGVLTVEDHSWGCIIRGTRIQIIAAGIVPLDKWPNFGKALTTFHAAVLLGGFRREVMIEQDDCPRDDKRGAVWVHYTEEERDCAPRVREALERLAAVQEQMLDIVASIRPTPLSEILAIPGAVLTSVRADEVKAAD